MVRFGIVAAVGIAMVLHLVAGNEVLNEGSYLLVLGASAVAAWLGSRRAPAEDRRIPQLIALGIGLNFVAECVWYSYDARGLQPDASWADVFYLACYAGLLGATWLTLVRAHRGRLGTDALLDVTTIVVITVLVFWSISVDAIVSDQTLTPTERVVLAAYPIVDAVLLALVLRASTDPRARQLMGVWFAAGVALWMVSDVLYLMLTVSATVEGWLDAGWMAGSCLMATAAWRRPDPDRVAQRLRERSITGQLLIAVLPLLVPALIAVVSAAVGRGERSLELLIGTGVLVVLTFVRTYRLLLSEQEARRELAIARDAALDASRAKSNFLATMSHEIRTPMNGVIGLTELLADTELDQRQLQYVDGVRGAGHALLAVINDILDFSKVEAGRLELEVIDFNLVQVVEDAAELVADSARSKELELITACSPELPTSLRGDPSRLRQVLLNLTNNAVKFTESGEVLVRAMQESAGDERVVVRFEVRDTGIGISEEDRVHLFQPFSQADSSTTRRFGGTGLGLAICHELVTAMGGAIGVDSQPGRGSTFWFTLGFEVATTEVGPATPDRGASVLEGLRALVVDDNATNRLILTEQLGAWGVEAIVVPDAEEALAALGREHVDLTVLDLMMPGVSGLDLARRVHEQQPAVRQVLLTSGPDVSLEDARSAGIEARLTKPIHQHMLRNALVEVMTPVRAAAPAGSDQGSLLGQEPPADDPVVRGHLLVVDDNEVNQMVAVGMLEHLGYTADTADDGAEALERIDATRYAAVLMDARMPGMDGFTATRELRVREEDGRRRTPVIALTAGVTEDERDECLEAGMDDYVTKPIDPVALQTALSRWAP